MNAWEAGNTATMGVPVGIPVCRVLSLERRRFETAHFHQSP